MIIFITGITSGFGKSMAETLNNDGHKVYGTYRKECTRLEGVNYIKADVRNSEEVKKAVDTILSKEDSIDVFINNAGIGIGGPIELSDLGDVETQMDTNWMGFIRCLHYVIPVMKRQNSGKIICFSSIGGVMGLPFQGFYSASKFAIEGTAESLRLELRDTNIKVVVIEPGDCATGFTAARKSITDENTFKAYPSYKRYLQRYENDEKTGLKPEVISRKISSIVKMKNPSYSYIIATPIQKLSVYIKRILPSRLYAYIFVSHYK